MPSLKQIFEEPLSSHRPNSLHINLIGENILSSHFSTVYRQTVLSRIMSTDRPLSPRDINQAMH